MSIKISEADVDYIADLARLGLEPEEKPKMVEHLGKILDYMEKLNQLDTEGVEPTSHVLSLQNAFREDQTVGGFSDGSLMENAPRKEKGHFQVPKIIGA